MKRFAHRHSGPLGQGVGRKGVITPSFFIFPHGAQGSLCFCCPSCCLLKCPSESSPVSPGTGQGLGVDFQGSLMNLRTPDRLGVDIYLLFHIREHADMPICVLLPMGTTILCGRIGLRQISRSKLITPPNVSHWSSQLDLSSVQT